MSAVTSILSIGVLSGFLIEMSVRAGVVLAIAMLLSPLVRRCSAAKAHLFWTLTLLAVLALPIFSLLLPGIDMPIWSGSAGAAHVDARNGLGVAPHIPQPDAAPGEYPSEGTPTAPEPAAPLWPAVVLGVWSVGATACLLRMLVGFVAVYRKSRTANPVTGPEWTSLLNDACRRARVTRPVRLVTASRNEVPATWGFLRTTIQFPPSASTWSESQTRTVLDHELAHVRRRDIATQFLAQVVCAVYWFNPLAWRVGSALRACAEHACDDLVLAGGARPSEYAQHLLTLWRSLRHSAVTPFPAIAMARPGSIEQRLQKLLDPRQDRNTPSRSITSAMLAAMMVFAGVFGTLHPTAQAESASPQLIVGPKLDAMNPEIRTQWQTQGITTDEQIFAKLQSISVEVIQRRLKLARMQNFTVQRLPEGKISVQISDPKDRPHVRELILRPGTLGFFEAAGVQKTLEVLKKIDQDARFHDRLLSLVEGGSSHSQVAVPEQNYEQAQAVVAEVNKSDGILPTDTTLMIAPKSPKANLYLMHKQSPMSDVTVKHAVARDLQGEPSILFVLSDADGKRMRDFTHSLVGKPIAIVVDGVPQSAPTVRGEISTNGQITGRFTPQEAADLAASLTSGSLPAPLIEVP